jgi:hypothetical protein
MTLRTPDKQENEDSIRALSCIVYVRLRKQNNYSVRHLFVVAAMRYTKQILLDARVEVNHSKVKKP